MSAWIVTRTHIDLLVTAGISFPRRACQGSYLRFGETRLSECTANEVGSALWLENYWSVLARYPDDEEWTDAKSDALAYTWSAMAIRGQLDPVTVLKAIDCYEYQSCEHEGWATSAAHQFCDDLRGACICLLPGYDDAPWGFDDPTYFERRRTVTA